MDKLYTILVADDETLLRKTLVEKLRGGGFSVIEAEDGLKASELSLTVRPDLILLDVEMPNMSGMEVIKRVRKEGEWGKKVSIIFLTSYDTTDAMMETIVKYNPSFYLRKSEINPDIIFTKVKESLKIS